MYTELICEVTDIDVTDLPVPTYPCGNIRPLLCCHQVMMTNIEIIQEIAIFTPADVFGFFLFCEMYLTVQTAALSIKST